MNNNFIKPGIVIQGPLISKGRVPRSASIKIPDLKESDVVEFNCVNQVIEICRIYSKNFPIVISTWKNEEQKLIEELKIIKSNNVEIILLDDITTKIDPVGKIAPGNNKLRQIFSTLEGAKKLLKFNCTHVIKVRSDMKIDIDLLWRDFLEVSSKRSLTLMVPSFALEQPSQISDFYYVCKISDLIEFFQELLKKKHWFFSIHNEYFYRWLKKKKIIVKFYVKIFGDTTVLKNLYAYAWNNFFAPASQNVFNSIVWRGEKFPKNRVNKNIFNDYFNNGNIINKNSFKLQKFIHKLYKRIIKFIF